MLKIAVLGSTRGTDLQAIIDAIETGKLTDVEISVVISNKEEAYILERASQHDIPAMFISGKDKTREEFDQEVMKILDDKGVGLVLLIGYMRFISKPFVDKWKNKVMNVHPSLLPKYAGGMDKGVHETVLIAGEKETGCTIHFVDEGADTGPIIIQKVCQIELDETVDTLKAKVQKLEGEAFIEAIGLFRDGKIEVKEDKVVIK
ncbi:MAG: phosphoribosylglycinamide formyltransferase [Nanoarchaeota archaeon]|nr:phosphoribosylglycinamide formyltransferase [Nanoarchaeota archaeon]